MTSFHRFLGFPVILTLATVLHSQSLTSIITLEHIRSLPAPTEGPWTWNEALAFPIRESRNGEPRLAVSWISIKDIANQSQNKSRLYFYDGNLRPMASFNTSTSYLGEFQGRSDYDEFMNLAAGDMDGNGKTEFVAVSRMADAGVYTFEWDRNLGALSWLNRHPGIEDTTRRYYQRSLTLGDFADLPGKEMAFGNSWGVLYLVDNNKNKLGEIRFRGKTIQNLLAVDIDEDGLQEILVAVGRDPGVVYALDYHPSEGLTVKWSTFVTETREKPSLGKGNNVNIAYHPRIGPAGTPAIVGVTEKEAGTDEGSIVMLDVKGRILWQKCLPENGGRYGGVELTDITGDGRPEILTRVTGEGHDDILIYDNAGNLLSRTYVGMTVASSGPYVFDIDQDGRRELLVFGRKGDQAEVRIYRINASYGTNLALNRAVYADSRFPGYPARLAVDGNPATQWVASSVNYPESFTVDLGSEQILSRTVADFEAGDGTRLYGYTLSVSRDNIVYAPVSDQSSNLESGRAYEAFTPVRARYVRLTFTNCNVAYGVPVIKEFSVFGGPGR